VLHYDALDKNLLQCEVLFAYTEGVGQSNQSALCLEYQDFTLHLSLTSAYSGEM
jgi:hypothetical protein